MADLGTGRGAVRPNAPSALGRVLLGEHALQRDLDEVGVAEELRPVGEEPPHRLRRAMNRSRGAGAGGREVEVLKNVQDLNDSRPARAWGRGAENGVPTVGAGHRSPLNGPIRGEVRRRNRAPVGRHVLCDQPCGLTLVELVRAEAHQPAEGRCEVLLPECVAESEETAFVEKDAARLLEAPQTETLPERSGQVPSHRKPLPGQPLGRLQHGGPILRPVLAECQCESADRSRDTRSPVSDQTVLGRSPLRIQVHVAMGGRRSPLAEIDERRPAVGKTNQHESAAPEVAGIRLRHRQSHSDGHGRIDCVPAVAQHLHAHRRRMPLGRDDHRLQRVRRLRSEGAARRRGCECR